MMSTALRRERALASRPKTECVSETWRVCRKTSMPKQAMMTAAMLTPPAPVWIA